uniref:Uncharacterized protein n=1 Tax=Arundo donax TaxID=35708 RepID=A0A0A9BKL9_ARUDO
MSRHVFFLGCCVICLSSLPPCLGAHPTKIWFLKFPTMFMNSSSLFQPQHLNIPFC